MKDTLHHFFYLASGTLLFVLLMVVLFRHKAKNEIARQMLLGYIGSFFLAVVAGYIVLTPNLIEQFPHFFRTAHFFYSLIMPFSFLYFREIVLPGKRSWKDGLLFLPVLLYLIDFAPIFLKSAAEKRLILQQLNDFGLRIAYAEGWIMPQGGYHVLRSFMAVLCWLMQAYLYVKVKKEGTLLKESKMQQRWLAFLLGSGVLIFLPNIITGLLHRSDLTIQWSNFAALTAALIQGYFLLLHPELLYGLQEDHRTVAKKKMVQTEGREESNNSLSVKPAYYDQLDANAITQIENAIQFWMGEKQLYLSPELTLAALSSTTGIGVHKWSAYFNKFEQVSFNDYINRYRIDYCVQKIVSGEHKTKTLEALSLESGFNSRSTFIRAFKKCKGVTPTQFIAVG